MNDPAAQAFMNAGRQIEEGRLPLWNGMADSAFMAEQWIQRIQKAATTGNLTDPSSCPTSSTLSTVML